MTETLRVTGDDLQELASRVSVLADQVHSFPFLNVGGMGGCGSYQVAAAADGANHHFELRSLLIETELRDLAAMARHVHDTMMYEDSRLAADHPGRIGLGLV